MGRRGEGEEDEEDEWEIAIIVRMLRYLCTTHRATNTAEYGREVTPLLFTSTTSLRRG